MKQSVKISILLISLLLFSVAPLQVHAEVTAKIFMSPATGEFTVGDTFSVPFYINTNEESINAINLKINFDPETLKVVQVSNLHSLFGFLAEPISFSNINGSSSFVGVVPGGVQTKDGLIATITFRAIKEGTTIVKMNQNSGAYLNNGFGTMVSLTGIQAVYNILPKAEEATETINEEQTLPQDLNQDEESKLITTQDTFSMLDIFKDNWLWLLLLFLLFLLILDSILKKRKEN